MLRPTVAVRRLGERSAAMLGVVVLLLAVGGSAGCAGADGEESPTADVASSATPLLDPTELVTNGIADVGADDALARSRDALRSAQSFRVAGSPSRGAPLDLVYVSTDDVVGSSGTVSQGGSVFELRAVNADVYVRGNLDWLADTVAAGATRTLGEAWLLLPDSLTDDLTVFVDPAALVDSLLVPTGAVRSVGVAMIDDRPALGVQFVDTEATVWLAGDGEPYPVLVERLGATATDGVLRFSDYDADVTVTAPKAADVVVVDDGSE